MPQALRKVFSARTAHPNTPETDKQAEVLHIVTGLNDDDSEWSKLVMASDPMTAIDLLSTMPVQQFDLLDDAP